MQTQGQSNQQQLSVFDSKQQPLKIQVDAAQKTSGSAYNHNSRPSTRGGENTGSASQSRGSIVGQSARNGISQLVTIMNNKARNSKQGSSCKQDSNRTGAINKKSHFLYSNGKTVERRDNLHGEGKKKNVTIVDDLNIDKEQNCPSHTIKNEQLNHVQGFGNQMGWFGSTKGNKSQKHLRKNQIIVQLPMKLNGNGDDDSILDHPDASKESGFSPERSKLNVQRNRSSANLAVMREMSSQILKKNDNLNLNTYKPFMNEFYKYSSDIFDFEDNIFQMNMKYKGGLDTNNGNNVKKRTTDMEVKTIERLIRKEFQEKIQRNEVEKLGKEPCKIMQAIKQMPPFENDKIPDEDIEMFQIKGKIGWKYIQEQIMTNNQFSDKIRQINMNKRFHRQITESYHQAKKLSQQRKTINMSQAVSNILQQQQPSGKNNNLTDSRKAQASNNQTALTPRRMSKQTVIKGSKQNQRGCMTHGQSHDYLNITTNDAARQSTKPENSTNSNARGQETQPGDDYLAGGDASCEDSLVNKSALAGRQDRLDSPDVANAHYQFHSTGGDLINRKKRTNTLQNKRSATQKYSKADIQFENQQQVYKKWIKPNRFTTPQKYKKMQTQTHKNSKLQYQGRNLESGSMQDSRPEGVYIDFAGQMQNENESTGRAVTAGMPGSSPILRNKNNTAITRKSYGDFRQTSTIKEINESKPDLELQYPHLVLYLNFNFRFAQIDKRLLIAKLINQKMLDIKPVENSMAQQQAMQEQRQQRQLNYSFIIDEKLGDEEVEQCSSIFQYIKLMNFKKDVQNQRETLLVKIIEKSPSTCHKRKYESTKFVRTDKESLQHTFVGPDDRYQYHEILFDDIILSQIGNQSKVRIKKGNEQELYSLFARVDPLIQNDTAINFKTISAINQSEKKKTCDEKNQSHRYDRQVTGNNHLQMVECERKGCVSMATTMKNSNLDDALVSQGMMANKSGINYNSGKMYKINELKISKDSDVFQGKDMTMPRGFAQRMDQRPTTQGGWYGQRMTRQHRQQSQQNPYMNITIMNKQMIKPTGAISSTNQKQTSIFKENESQMSCTNRSINEPLIQGNLNSLSGPNQDITSSINEYNLPDINNASIRFKTNEMPPHIRQGSLNLPQRSFTSCSDQTYFLNLNLQDYFKNQNKDKKIPNMKAFTNLYYDHKVRSTNQGRGKSASNQCEEVRAVESNGRLLIRDSNFVIDPIDDGQQSGGPLLAIADSATGIAEYKPYDRQTNMSNLEKIYLYSHNFKHSRRDQMSHSRGMGHMMSQKKPENYDAGIDYQPQQVQVTKTKSSLGIQQASDQNERQSPEDLNNVSQENPVEEDKFLQSSIDVNQYDDPNCVNNLPQPDCSSQGNEAQYNSFIGVKQEQQFQTAKISMGQGSPDSTKIFKKYPRNFIADQYYNKMSKRFGVQVPPNNASMKIRRASKISFIDFSNNKKSKGDSVFHQDVAQNEMQQAQQPTFSQMVATRSQMKANSVMNANVYKTKKTICYKSYIKNRPTESRYTNCWPSAKEHQAQAATTFDCCDSTQSLKKLQSDRVNIISIARNNSKSVSSNLQSNLK